MPASPLTSAIRPRPAMTSSKEAASLCRSWSRSSSSKTQSKWGLREGWGNSFSLERENWQAARNRARDLAKQIARCQVKNNSRFVRKPTSRKHNADSVREARLSQATAGSVSLPQIAGFANWCRLADGAPEGVALRPRQSIRSTVTEFSPMLRQPPCSCGPRRRPATSPRGRCGSQASGRARRSRRRPCWCRA